MDVLIVARNDWANMGYRLQESLKKVGVDAHAVAMVVNYSCGSKHAEVCGRDKIKNYIKSAKIIQFMHSEIECFNLKPLDILNKRIFVFHGGGRYRENPESRNKIFNPIVEKSIIQTGDLLDLGAKNEVWLLPPVDTDGLSPSYKRRDSEKLLISHFPSSALVKNSANINIVIDKLKKDFDNRFSYTYSNKRVHWPKQMKRVSRCDIYIEACTPELKYGNNYKKYGEWGLAGVEAAALGKIVVSHFLSNERYEKEYGECGIIVSNSIDELEENLRHLLSLSFKELLVIRKKTRKWVEDFHSYGAVGKKLKEEIYEI